MAKQSNQGPPSMAGLMMFYDANASKVTIKPETVVGITIAFVGLILLLKVI